MRALLVAVALARRMGIMYVIWSDHLYAAWNRFQPEGYLSSSCRSKRRCSKTLRHRDHMHLSLSKAGAKALTSFYVGELGQVARSGHWSGTDRPRTGARPRRGGGGRSTPWTQ